MGAKGIKDELDACTLDWVEAIESAETGNAYLDIQSMNVFEFALHMALLVELQHPGSMLKSIPFLKRLTHSSGQE